MVNGEDFVVEFFPSIGFRWCWLYFFCVNFFFLCGVFGGGAVCFLVRVVGWVAKELVAALCLWSVACSGVGREGFSRVGTDKKTDSIDWDGGSTDGKD